MATYYVSVQTGSDYQNGLTPDTAFATVTRAVSVATAGSKIIVAPGEYGEYINSGLTSIEIYGDVDSKYFSNVRPGEIVFTSYKHTNGRRSGLANAFYVDARGWKFINLKFIGFHSVALRMTNADSNTLVQNCVFEDCSTNHIENNLTTQSWGIYVNPNGGGTPTVEKCKFINSNNFHQSYYYHSWYHRTQRVMNFIYKNCEFKNSTVFGATIGNSSYAYDGPYDSSRIHFFGCRFDGQYPVAEILPTIFNGCTFENLTNIVKRNTGNYGNYRHHLWFYSCHFKGAAYLARTLAYSRYYNSTFENIGRLTSEDGNPLAFEMRSSRIFGVLDTNETTNSITYQADTMYKPFDHENLRAAGVELERLKPLTGLQSAKIMVPRAGFATFKVPVDKNIPINVRFKFFKNFENGRITIWLGSEKKEITNLAKDTTVTVDFAKTPVQRGFEELFIFVENDGNYNPSHYLMIDDFEVRSGSDITAPAIPTGLTATAGDEQIALSWNANTEADVTSYYIYRDHVRIAEVPAEQLEYIDTGLTNYETYEYQILAVDLSGNRSDKTAIVALNPVDLTPPAAPTGLATTQGDGQVILDWTANAEIDLAGYNVYYRTVGATDFVKHNESVYVGTTYKVDGLTNYTDYEFTITAIDVHANESAEATIVTQQPVDLTAPNIPTGLTLVTNDGNQVEFQWTANTEADLSGYYVYKNGVKLANLLTVASFVDTAVIEKSTYAYTVTSVDDKGNESDQSSPLEITIPDITSPAKPTGLAHFISGHDVTVQWNENTETDIAGYNVYRNDVKINTSLVGVPAYTDANLTEEMTYTYKVTAVDTAGNESVMSDSVAATIPDYTAPDAPTLNSVTANGTDISVEFGSSASADVVTYNIFRSQDTVNFSKVTTIDASVIASFPHTYVDSGLSEEVTYQYYVTAVDEAGNESGTSATKSAKTADLTAPDAPTQLTSSQPVTPDGTITLNWTAPTATDVTKYVIYFADNAATPVFSVVGEVTNTTYTHPAPSTIAEGQEVLFYVTAVDEANNESAASNTVSETY